MKAIEKYDIERKGKKATFNTYAHYYIRNHCLNYMRNNASRIRQPVRNQIEKTGYKISFLDLDDDTKKYKDWL